MQGTLDLLLESGSKEGSMDHVVRRKVLKTNSRKQRKQKMGKAFAVFSQPNRKCTQKSI